MSVFQNKKATRVAHGLLAAAALATCQEAAAGMPNCGSGQYLKKQIDSTKKVYDCYGGIAASTRRALATGAAAAAFNNAGNRHHVSDIDQMIVSNGNTHTTQRVDAAAANRPAAYFNTAVSATPNYSEWCCMHGVRINSSKELRGWLPRARHTVDANNCISGSSNPWERADNVEYVCENCPTGKYRNPESSFSCSSCPTGMTSPPGSDSVADCSITYPIFVPTETYDSKTKSIVYSAPNAETLVKSHGYDAGCSAYSFLSSEYSQTGLYAYTDGSYVGKAYFGTDGVWAEHVKPATNGKVRLGKAIGPTPVYTEDEARALALQLGLKLGTAGNSCFPGQSWDFAGTYGTKGLYAYRTGDYAGVAFYGRGEIDAQMATELPADGSKYRPSPFDTIYFCDAMDLNLDKRQCNSRNECQIRRALQMKPSSDAHDEGEKADDKQSGMKRSAGDEEESKIHSIVKRFKFNVEQLKP